MPLLETSYAHNIFITTNCAIPNETLAYTRFGRTCQKFLSRRLLKLLPTNRPDGYGKSNGTHDEKGQDIFRNGIRTYMKRLPTGANWALLYNASMEFDPQDMQFAASTVQEVRKVIEGSEKYPDLDLFGEIP